MIITFDVPEDKVAAVAAAVQAVLAGPATPGEEDWRNETGFPKVKTINGVTMMLKAPLNPLWRGSVTSEVFTSYGKTGADPSNSPDPDTYPLRSPGGFPMVYPVVLDTDGKLHVSNKVPPRISFDGQTFENDALVSDYIMRSKMRDDNLKAGDAAYAASVETLYPGALDIRTLDAEGLKFLWLFSTEIGGDSTRVGPADIRKRFHHWMDYAGNMDDGTGHAPALPGLPATQGWTTDEFKAARNGGWDWSGYHGPARKLLPRLGE